MAMKRVKQSEVTWVPRDKKTGKGGFLALRSDKSKPFSGVVTGVKKGTTAASASGEAVYRGGKNIRKVAAREAAKRATAPRPSVTDRSKTTPAAATPAKRPTRISPAVAERKTMGRARTPMSAAMARNPQQNMSIARLESQLQNLIKAAGARKRMAAQTAAAKAAQAADAKRIADLKAAIAKAKG